MKRKPIKFEKPGREKVNPGQNLFGSTRLSDDSQFGQAGQEKRILYVCWCLEAERNERPFFFFDETWLRESEARSKFVWVHKAEC